MLNLRRWFSADRQPLEHLYLFVHLPKCGGTSLLRTLSVIGGERSIAIAETSGKSAALAEVRRMMADRKISAQQLDLIMGRDVYFGMHSVSPRSPRYFTFLRDPVERYISQYRFYVDCVNDASHKAHELSKERVMRGGQLMTLEDYVQSKQGTNLIAKVLAVADNPAGSEDRWWSAKAKTARPFAIEMLERMAFIGFVESFQQDATTICKQLRIEPDIQHVNASTTQIEVPPDILDQIRDLNALDLEIYEHARKLASKLTR